MFDIQSFIQNLADLPGIYQMIDHQEKVLYVGKAKRLKQRVSSYFRCKTTLDIKTQALVKRIASIEVILTQTENEALILEGQLIKKYHPPYNILFRDDKTYPYIFLSEDDFPYISLYRGVKKEKGTYFGPYANVRHLKKSLRMIQKLFHIRPCRNVFFRSRSRPCLQYQIGRCYGPCVGLISKADYLENIHFAKLFLEGKYNVIMDALEKRMQTASDQLHYEVAVKYRDQIAELRAIQGSQVIWTDRGNMDFLAISEAQSMVCIQLLIVRNGKLMDSRSFFPKVPHPVSVSNVLAAFVSQYYLDPDHFVPDEMILNRSFSGMDVFQEACESFTKKKVVLKTRVRSVRAKWLEIALLNAEQALQSRGDMQSSFYKKYVDLKEALSLGAMPERIECFDISHMGGEETVASCVVFDRTGPCLRDYRRFNIKSTVSGDDLAAMAEVLHRRYTRVQCQKGTLPDIVLVDGGKEQLKKALEVFDALQLNQILLLGIAKGVTRKPGDETVYRVDQKRFMTVTLGKEAFHLLQQIRDEAHRFAITGHRLKKRRKVRYSRLADIPGMGIKRRQALLKRFGGLQGVCASSVEDLMKVKGIGSFLAKEIHRWMMREDGVKSKIRT